MEIKLSTIKKIYDELLFAYDMHNTEEEKRNVENLMNILMFGEEFMNSDNKGTLKEYKELQS